jgi:hypothetical protein
MARRTGATRARVGPRKWQPIFVLDCYQLTLAGLDLTQVAATLGVTRQLLWMWQKRFPELKEAFRRAQSERKDQGLADWVYERLTPELQEAWKKLQAWDKGEEPGGLAAIEALLARGGLYMRQRLYLHALASSHFNQSEALRLVNVTKRDLERWLVGSPEFATLVSEIGWHKENYFEGKLVSLIAQGHAGATIFANRTVNAARGYAKPTEVDVRVSGQVAVGVFDLAALLPYLSEQARGEVMQALRKLEVGPGPPPPVDLPATLSARIAGGVVSGAGVSEVEDST